VPYLGEINDPRQNSWQKTIEVFDEEPGRGRSQWTAPGQSGTLRRHAKTTSRSPGRMGVSEWESGSEIIGVTAPRVLRTNDP
jgi:hypothetical protein